MIGWTAWADRSKTSARDYVSLSHAVGEITDEADAWREAGGTDLSVVTMGLGLDSVDDHIDYLASIAAALHLP